ncbi:MAG: hypothetical protein NTV00_04485 [Methylococcales bacterium]|nr:hypothetical protein [Methylococcales bacterium]
MNTCAIVADDLSLHVRALSIGGQNYKAQLNYAPDKNPKYWTYGSHVLE